MIRIKIIDIPKFAQKVMRLPASSKFDHCLMEGGHYEQKLSRMSNSVHNLCLKEDFIRFDTDVAAVQFKLKWS